MVPTMQKLCKFRAFSASRGNGFDCKPLSPPSPPCQLISSSSPLAFSKVASSGSLAKILEKVILGIRQKVPLVSSSAHIWET